MPGDTRSSTPECELGGLVRPETSCWSGLQHQFGGGGGDLGVARHVKHVCAIQQGLVLQPLYLYILIYREPTRTCQCYREPEPSSVPMSDAHI